jgi:hypothetical protein
MIPLRRFNDQGIARFRELLSEIRANGDADVYAILWDDALTEQLSAEPVLDVRPFGDRREAGEYLYEVVSRVSHEIEDVERDPGLWSWLAAAWMDHIAPVDNGRRQLGATARWIPAVGDYQKYYRHLLAGPYQIFRAHREDPDRAMVLLATGVGSPGEAAEQLSARQEILSNGNFLEAATRLYYDAEQGKLKRGSGGKGPGSPRRLAKDMLEQFTLTWDFYGMGAAEIVSLLPAEFDRFRTV